MITDQPGKMYYFWLFGPNKKYVRFAGGKADKGWEYE
jgi:hypothetical protein